MERNNGHLIDYSKCLSYSIRSWYLSLLNIHSASMTFEFDRTLFTAEKLAIVHLM